MRIHMAVLLSTLMLFGCSGGGPVIPDNDPITGIFAGNLVNGDGPQYIVFSIGGGPDEYALKFHTDVSTMLAKATWTLHYDEDESTMGQVWYASPEAIDGNDGHTHSVVGYGGTPELNHYALIVWVEGDNGIGDRVAYETVEGW